MNLHSASLDYDLTERINELTKMLQLHFSDLGEVMSVKFNVQYIPILEPVHFLDNSILDSSTVATLKGLEFTVKFTFRPSEE